MVLMTAPDSGIGITFLSQYSATAPIGTDTYYRLRRHGSNSFHISPHGTTVAGDIDTDVVPMPNTWYRFKVEVQDTGLQTEIRAKVWAEGSGEPTDWQVEAYDDSPTRLTSGRIGLWSFLSGNKYWDDLGVQPLGN